MTFLQIPDNGPWNYNFMDGKHTVHYMEYGVKLGTLLEFHHEDHQPAYFPDLSDLEEGNTAKGDGDREDTC